MTAESWYRYRETLDSLLEGFQIIGRDWRYLYVNPAAARHGRRSADELLGRRMGDVYPGFEDTPLFRALRRCMDEGEPASFENLFTFPDNTARWFQIRVEPVPEGICVHSVDVHDRKAAEAALREQEAIATLGQMAAVVAHEVKNPLAGMSGVLQVLKARRTADHPEVPLFDEMLASIRGLERLVQDLLVYTRPITLDARPVAVADVVRDALLLAESDEVVKRHAISARIEDAAAVIIGDAALLKNVLRNLLLNASQAMEAPGEIQVGVSCEPGVCRVTVADTGPGVPGGLAGRIFDPFVTGRKGGTGLGLAISRRIVRLHGGDLDLVAAGRGATFVLTLPLSTAGASTAIGPLPDSRR